MRQFFIVLFLLFSANLQASEVVSDLKGDSRFDYAVAKSSMGDPADFKYEGLYLLQPVQQDKEVVLFVHGANGSPRDWADVAGHLDTHQQAWFVYYASGDTVSRSGTTLAQQVLDLMRQNGITRIRVVAHSMGGLVAWYLVRGLEQAPDIQLEQFMTVATPWNGNFWAKLGTYLSFHPADSWRDLSPGSETLQTIWNTPLKTPYTLVYTVKREGGSDDGAIALDSELATPMEKQAGILVKIVASHVGVLHGSNAEQLAALVSGS